MARTRDNCNVAETRGEVLILEIKHHLGQGQALAFMNGGN